MGNEQTVDFIPNSKLLRTLLVIGLFALGFGIRLYDASNRPFYELSVRQFHSAVIAKGYYYALADIPADQQEAVVLNRDRQPINEPQITEQIVGTIWYIIGSDNILVPAAVTSLFWLIGGLFLFLTAREFLSFDASLIVLSVFLFLPHGIIDSNNFQPDSLMLMGVLISMYLIVQYHKEHSLRWLILAGVVSGVTIFAKLQSAFIIAGFYAVLGIYHRGFFKMVLSRDSILYAVLALTPIALYLFDGFFISGHFHENASGRILPQLFLDPDYWRGWLKLINNTVGFSGFVIGLTGLLLAKGKFRYTILGLLAGYLFLGSVFTWNIHTHRYYHLPLTPFVALSMGSIATVIFANLRKEHDYPLARLAVVGLWLLGIGFGMLVVIADGEDQINYQSEVDDALAIGEYLQHNTNVLYLSESYGLPFIYYSEVAGDDWLQTNENRWRGIVGLSVDRTPDDVIALTEANEIIPEPEYFVITDMDDWAAQPELEIALNDNYTLVVETDTYLIYDMRAEQ
ncbi:MAG: glycosyltransferase family 39 protein [Chloroflexota bacterium]